MAKPESIRQRDQLLWEAALELVPRGTDRSRDPEAVIQALEQVLPRDDPNKQHRKKSELFFKEMTHPGRTEPVGQLLLFGDLYDYEPDRPVIGYGDRVVEQKFAPPSFKTAEAQRAREKTEDAQRWSNRKTSEAESYSAWALEQALAGRPALELTFDNFVRETGIWRAAS